MSNEDYQKGLIEGFKLGVEEGKKLAPKPTRLDDYVFGSPGCSVCGRYFSGVEGYVCMHPGCPSRVTCGTPMTAYSTGPTEALHGILDSGLGKAIWS